MHVTSAEGQCMLCKSMWSDDIMRSLFSSHWYDKTYAHVQMNFVFERERQFFPITLEKIQYEKLREQWRKTINTHDSLFRDIRNIIDNIRRSSFASSVESWQELVLLCSTMRIEDLAFFKNLDVDDLRIISQHEKQNKAKYTPVLRLRCPTQDCRGLLSTHFKCAVCETKACRDCHRKQTDEHKCNPDDIESAKLIKSECKSCPNTSCNVPIFKVEGCRQMFCTSCKTCFDWETRNIINGNVHNPHYFEWLASQSSVQQQQQPVVQQQNNNCQDGQITDDMLTMLNRIQRLNTKNVALQSTALFLYTFLINVREIADYPATLIPNPINPDILQSMNAKERSEYLQSHITEEQFKQHCFKTHRAYMRNKNIADICSMLYMATGNAVSVTAWSRMQPSSFKTKEAIEMLQPVETQCRALMRYFNQSMIKMAKKFSSKAGMQLFNHDGSRSWVSDPKAENKEALINIPH